MAEVNIPLRAKSGYIAVKRRDKSGRVVDAKDHVVVSEGMFTAAEMEREMIRVAEQVGADESQIRVEYYEPGQAPIEVNPRHRGTGPTVYSNGERRRVFGGWNPKVDS